MEGPTPQVASHQVKRVTFSPYVTVHSPPDFGLQAIEDGTGGIEGEALRLSEKSVEPELT